MKKAIHIKQYYRKKHGRADFGGEVSSHNKRMPRAHTSPHVVPIKSAIQKGTKQRRKSHQKLYAELEKYPPRTQEALLMGGRTLDDRYQQVYTAMEKKRIEAMMKEREVAAKALEDAKKRIEAMGT